MAHDAGNQRSQDEHRAPRARDARPPAPAPVRVSGPATLPVLLAGLAGLWWFRRRTAGRRE